MSFLFTVTSFLFNQPYNIRLEPIGMHETMKNLRKNTVVKMPRYFLCIVRNCFCKCVIMAVKVLRLFNTVKLPSHRPTGQDQRRRDETGYDNDNNSCVQL